jgi:hypothetical protein
MIAALKMLCRRAYVEGQLEAATFMLDTLVNDTPIGDAEIAAFQREVQIAVSRHASEPRKPAGKPADDSRALGVLANKPLPRSPSPAAAAKW